MSRTNYNLWTGERKRIVANLLREGKSAGQIASYMEISRSSVIGLVHRDATLNEIGFARSKGPSEKSKAALSSARRTEPKSASKRPTWQLSKVANVKAEDTANETIAAKPAPVAGSVRQTTLDLPLAELSRNQCRFATNKAAKGEVHLFCGLDTRPGSSFCDHHHRIVFVSTTNARKGVDQ